MKLDERLKQIEKRIAELQRKADVIKSELPSANTSIKTLEVYQLAENIIKEYAEIQQPRRRGRKKLNETE